MTTFARRLNVGAVSLVRGRVRNDISILSEARDELEKALDAKFFDNAPFDAIGVIILYGEEENLSPKFNAIKKRYLSIEIELPMEKLRKATTEELHAVFKNAILEGLRVIGQKYKLPIKTVTCN